MPDTTKLERNDADTEESLSMGTPRVDHISGESKTTGGSKEITSHFQQNQPIPAGKGGALPGLVKGERAFLQKFADAYAQSADARLLGAKGYTTQIDVTGYASIEGESAHNQALGQNRADTIAGWFREAFKANKITNVAGKSDSKGNTEADPEAKTEEERAPDRKTVTKLVNDSFSIIGSLRLSGDGAGSVSIVLDSQYLVGTLDDQVTDADFVGHNIDVLEAVIRLVDNLTSKVAELDPELQSQASTTLSTIRTAVTGALAKKSGN